MSKANSLLNSTPPEVSVIIIVHNDPVNLVASVESAKNQTARNLEIVVVDDCSDDDSYRVALQLAATDPRILVLQTDHNTGGPGAPRNLGVRGSTAPWITFVDSDDSLEPAAVEIMLAAAKEDGADVVCGQTRRLHLAEDRWAGWRAGVYQERRHLASVNECLDLAMDTMAPAKLFRRTFLEQNQLSFDEYMHFEDLVFTAAIYKHASSISIVPDYVYIWKVYPTEIRRSITHQRHDERSLEYRLQAMERIEQIVGERGHERLRNRLRLKFLQHDARLYLQDSLEMSQKQAQRVLRRLETRLRLIPPEIYAELPIRRRLMYGMALSHCIEGVRETLQWSPNAVTLAGRTSSIDGHVLWRPAGAEPSMPMRGSLEHHLLDITDDPILATPFPLIKYEHSAQSVVQQADGGVRISGTTLDPFRRIVDRFGQSNAVALFRLREAPGSFTCPVSLQSVDDCRLSWEFIVRVPSGLPFVRPMRFGVSMQIDKGDSLNSSPVSFGMEDAPAARVLSSGPLRSSLRQQFVLYRTQAGRLGLKLARTRGRRGSVEKWLLRLYGVGSSESG